MQMDAAGVNLCSQKGPRETREKQKKKDKKTSNQFLVASSQLGSLTTED
jgi:hypothetical protein